MNGYICLFKGKRVEVFADTSYQAQQKASALLKARKSYEVVVMLAQLDGKQYTHNAGGL